MDDYLYNLVCSLVDDGGKRVSDEGIEERKSMSTENAGQSAPSASRCSSVRVGDLRDCDADSMRFFQCVADLIRSLEGVQDWKGTEVGDNIERIEELMNR